MKRENEFLLVYKLTGIERSCDNCSRMKCPSIYAVNNAYIIWYGCMGEKVCDNYEKRA